MIDVNELELKERNIRLYKGRYVVKINRRKNTLSESKKLVKYLNQYINCVNIYEDIKNNKFMVQSYKEYKTLEEAIKVRNLIEQKLREYENYKLVAA